MTSIIVIVNAGIDFFKILQGCVNRYDVSASGERMVIERDAKHVIVDQDPYVRDEYEDYEMAIVLKRIPDPKFYAVGFNDLAFVKQVLMRAVDDSEFLIDDDHGCIQSGSEFVKRLRDDPDYNWMC